ncbi:unnamed protein product [Prorocentrum cordatum]|uniref:Ion transport domain-containing protein n=1 Tax=Prorocentrum cordatum TaxID=2364126 RepID=A0ABN9QN86_9DINO|nr:unnamed protein product [Polarella glacialis]
MRTPRGDEELADADEGNDFESLIRRARQAHNLNVRCLEAEVQRLRERLAAVMGDHGDADILYGGEQPAVPPFSRTKTDDDQISQEVALPDVKGQPRREISGSSKGFSEFSNDTGVGRRITEISTPGSRQAAVSRGFSSTLRRQASWERFLARKGVLFRVVQHPAFEMFVAGMILINGCVMAAESQYHGFDLAVWTGHSSADGVSSSVWPHGEAVFEICDWVFGAFFAAEIVIKVVGLRLEFTKDCWNWVDLSVVALCIVASTWTWT